MNNLLNHAKVFWKHNGATVLTCVGAAGVVATAVSAVKATPKALRLIEQAKEEKGEDLTTVEVVKVAGPTYFPSILMGAATITCMVGSNALNKKHQAALASAYAMLDASFKDYKDKVIELYGQEADDKVREEIAKDKYDETSISVDDGKHLFYDEFSERYFEAKMEDVIGAEYEINRKISLWGGASVNEFYEALGISEVDYGDFLGWSSGGLMDMTWSDWLDFEHQKVQLEDGMECCIITMSVEPMYEYEYY